MPRPGRRVKPWGSSHAQIELALAYLEGGLGLPKDIRQAWVWLKTAAAQESKPAEEALSRMN